MKKSSIVLALAMSMWGAEIVAQELQPPPEVSLRDDVGVDVNSGYAATTLNDISIGTGVNSLSHTIATYDNHFGFPGLGFYDDFHVGIARIQISLFNGDGEFIGVYAGDDFQKWTVTIGHDSTRFISNYDNYTPLMEDGSSLVKNTDGSFLFTTRNGAVTHFAHGGNFINTTYPNGFVVTRHYRIIPGDISRLQSVTTNTGLQFKYEYASNTYGSAASARYNFYSPTKITALNNGVEYCDPTSDSCAFGQDWPDVTYSWPTYAELYGSGAVIPSIFTVTDAGGRVTSFTQEGMPLDAARLGTVGYEPRVTEVKQSTSAGPATTTYEYDHQSICITTCRVVYSNIVVEARRGNALWTYDYPQALQTPYIVGTNTSHGPFGDINVTLDSLGGLGTETGPFWASHYNGNYIQHSQDDKRRVILGRISAGNESTFQYDSRGNMTIRADDAGTTSTVDDSVTEAGFDTCTSANFKWCNKPRWVEDAYGNRTDIEYDNAHGMVTKVTRPAPAAGAARPQTRYFYQQYYAWHKNSAGSTVQASLPVWLLQKESSCALGAASGNGCANSNYEVTIEHDYGVGSSTQANNLWLRGTTVKAYVDNYTTLETRRTCYQYDDVGNVIAETLPAANLASCN